MVGMQQKTRENVHLSLSRAHTPVACVERSAQRKCPWTSEEARNCVKGKQPDSRINLRSTLVKQARQLSDRVADFSKTHLIVLMSHRTSSDCSYGGGSRSTEGYQKGLWMELPRVILTPRLFLKPLSD